MAVRERVRERAAENLEEKDGSVEILMGSLRVEARLRRGERSGESWGELVGEGKPPVEKRLLAVGVPWEAMAATVQVEHLGKEEEGGEELERERERS